MKQPIFFPGKELKAKDLISLEEYAFSRTNITSPDHGVVSLFNNRSQPEQKQEGGQYYFIIKEVNGITPAGRPIKFKINSDRMALRISFPSVGVVIWDIYVNDNHPEGKGTADPSGEKYTLSNISVSNVTDKPKIEEDKLYLGRYKLEKNIQPEIIAPPYIYSLASFDFPSDKWQLWTFPIRDALRRVVKKNSNEYVHNFIKHIVYNYPFWPLSDLLRASNELAWLCKADAIEEILDEGRMADLQHSLVNNPLPVSVYNIAPNEIPTKIAEIIGGGGDIDWKLIVAENMKVANNMLTIDKHFIGEQEILFKFKPGIEPQEYVRLNVNSFYIFEAPRFEELDTLNNTCYCFMILYDEQSEEQKFTLSLPKGWDINNFNVYHRMSKENKELI